MRETKPPFKVLQMYDQKILANRCELILMKVGRTKELHEKDAKVFNRLHKLLQTALQGDIAVSGSGMATSSEQSLEVLRETFKALVNSLPEVKAFKIKLTNLAKTAQMIAERGLPAQEQLDELAAFCHSYSMVQAQLLKEHRTSQLSEASLWPLTMQLGYS